MPQVPLAAAPFAVPPRLTPANETALAQRLADGDHSALDAIYRRHAPALRRYARGDVAARNERLRVALRRMAELPARQREALALRAIDGREYDELAAHFDLTENATVQLVHRARRNLTALVAA